MTSALLSIACGALAPLPCSSLPPNVGSPSILPGYEKDFPTIHRGGSLMSDRLEDQHICHESATKSTRSTRDVARGHMGVTRVPEAGRQLAHQDFHLESRPTIFKRSTRFAPSLAGTRTRTRTQIQIRVIICGGHKENIWSFREGRGGCLCCRDSNTIRTRSCHLARLTTSTAVPL